MSCQILPFGLSDLYLGSQALGCHSRLSETMPVEPWAPVLPTTPRYPTMVPNYQQQNDLTINAKQRGPAARARPPSKERYRTVPTVRTAKLCGDGCLDGLASQTLPSATPHSRSLAGLGSLWKRTSLSLSLSHVSCHRRHLDFCRFFLSLGWSWLISLLVNNAIPGVKSYPDAYATHIEVANL